MPVQVLTVIKQDRNHGNGAQPIKPGYVRQNGPAGAMWVKVGLC